MRTHKLSFALAPLKQLQCQGVQHHKVFHTIKVLGIVLHKRRLTYPSTSKDCAHNRTISVTLPGSEVWATGHFLRAEHMP
jgi:hypothetical protein